MLLVFSDFESRPSPFVQWFLQWACTSAVQWWEVRCAEPDLSEFTVRVTRYFTPVSYSALMHTENHGFSEPSTRDKSYPTSFILIYTSAAIYFFFIFHTSMLRPLWFTAGLARINSKVAPQTQLIKVVVWQRRRPFTLANDLSRSALWVLCFPVEPYRSKMCLFFFTASMPLMLT